MKLISAFDAPMACTFIFAFRFCFRRADFRRAKRLRLEFVFLRLFYFVCSLGLRRDRCGCCYVLDTPMACAIIFAFHISAAPTFAALEAGVFVFSFVLQYGLSSRWMLARVHFSNIWLLWFTFSAFHYRLTFPVFQRPICSSLEL